MTVQKNWEKFIDILYQAANSNVFQIERSYKTHRFWRLLWTLKDDTSALNKSCKIIHEIRENFYLIDSKKYNLTLLVISILKLNESKIIDRIFEAFLELYKEEKNYMNYILRVNKMDSSLFQLIKLKRDFFQDFELKVKGCENLWLKLNNVSHFDCFSEDEADRRLREFYNYFKVLSGIGHNLECVLDKIHDQSKRGYFHLDFINMRIFNISNKELKDQFEILNDLYRYELYDVMIAKIRLILEFLLIKLIKSRNLPVDYSLNRKIDRFYENFKLTNNTSFPTTKDHSDMHKLREWGNLSTHDIFPAITKTGINDMKPLIERILKKLINLDKDLF